MMRIRKVGSRWTVTGSGTGWLCDCRYKRKWEAKLACEVFKKGGSVVDYARVRRKKRKRRRSIRRDRERARMEKILSRICSRGGGSLPSFY